MEGNLQVQFSSFEIFLAQVIQPISLLGGLLTMLFQVKNRTNTMKNFRYFLHLILLVFLMNTLMEMVEIYTLESDIDKLYRLNGNSCESALIEDKSLKVECYTCRISGALGVFIDFCTLLLTLSFTQILKRLVSNPSNPKLYAHTLMIGSFSLAFMLTFLIYVTIGFGISALLSCGLAIDESTTIDLVRCWPILVLPLIYYNTHYLNTKVPTLIYQTVRTLVMQCNIYIGFFTLYIFFRLVYSISILLTNLQYEELNQEGWFIAMRASVWLCEKMHVAMLIVVVSLNEGQTRHIIKMAQKVWGKKGNNKRNVSMVDIK